MAVQLHLSDYHSELASLARDGLKAPQDDMRFFLGRDGAKNERRASLRKDSSG